MRKVIIAAAVCAVTAVSVVLIPDMMIQSYPTAKNVSIEKISYTDTFEIEGSIVKNAKDDKMYVKAFADEKDIADIYIGQKAEITGKAFSDCIYSGEVSYIADFASTRQFGNLSRTVVEVHIDIISPDERLKPGYTASSTIILSDTEIIDIVPYEIIEQDDNGEFVYVLENNIAEKRYIKTGRELVNGIEIISGIKNTDIIIKPTDLLEEGDTVLIEE